MALQPPGPFFRPQVASKVWVRLYQHNFIFKIEVNCYILPTILICVAKKSIVFTPLMSILSIFFGMGTYQKSWKRVRFCSEAPDVFWAEVAFTASFYLVKAQYDSQVGIGLPVYHVVSSNVSTVYSRDTAGLSTHQACESYRLRWWILVSCGFCAPYVGGLSLFWDMFGVGYLEVGNLWLSNPLKGDLAQSTDIHGYTVYSCTPSSAIAMYNMFEHFPCVADIF